MQADELKKLIEEGIPGARAEIRGDGDHFEGVVVAEAFSGKKMLEQHRMVYDTLGDLMHNEIHAFSMRTYTPEEWEQAAS